MYTGVDRKKAIRAWQSGRDVRVLDRNIKDSAGNIPLMPLDNLLKGYEFLVDAPAVENPELKESFPEETSGKESVPAQEESEKEEETGPPSRGRNQNRQ